MALSMVETSGQQVTATSASRTLAAIAEGDLMVAAFSAQSATTTITPPSGFAQDASISLTGTTKGGIWSKVAGAGESTTVTFGSSESVVLNLQVWRISGNATSPLDKTNTNSGVVVSALTTGSTGTLSQANEIAIGMAMTATNNGGTEAVDSSFTIRSAATHNRILVADRIVSATTALNPSFSWATAQNATAAIATYKEAAATVSGTTAATWATWTATAQGTVSEGVTSGTTAATWATWTATALGVVSEGVTSATTVATWGQWSATAQGTVSEAITSGSSAATWGQWTATVQGAVSEGQTAGTAIGTWSEWSATAAGLVAVQGAAAGTWGQWTATALGVVTESITTGLAEATWGPLIGSAVSYLGLGAPLNVTYAETGFTVDIQDELTTVAFQEGAG